MTEYPDQTYADMDSVEFDRGPTVVIDCRSRSLESHVGIYPLGVANGVDGGGWVQTTGGLRIRVKGENGRDTVLDIDGATGKVVLR